MEQNSLRKKSVLAPQKCKFARYKWDLCLQHEPTYQTLKFWISESRIKRSNSLCDGEAAIFSAVHKMPPTSNNIRDGKLTFPILYICSEFQRLNHSMDSSDEFSIAEWRWRVNGTGEWSVNDGTSAVSTNPAYRQINTHGRSRIIPTTNQHIVPSFFLDLCSFLKTYVWKWYL